MKSILPRREDFVNLDRIHGGNVFYYSRQTAFCLYRSLKLSSVCNIEILLDRPVKEVNLMKEPFS